MKACRVSGGTAPLIILGNWLRVVVSLAHNEPRRICPTYSHSSQEVSECKHYPSWLQICPGGCSRLLDYDIAAEFVVLIAGMINTHQYEVSYV
jgi:hypothetical protein